LPELFDSLHSDTSNSAMSLLNLQDKQFLIKPIW
jgi:hypothetical protein